MQAKFFSPPKGTGEEIQTTGMDDNNNNTIYLYSHNV